MKRTVLIWAALAVVAAGYFVVDVRQRARLDRGLKRHRTDFTVYQYAARALKHGEDPYEARNPRGYRYVYPPFLAVMLQPVADWEPQNAALVFYAASLLALIGAVLLLRRMAGVGWMPLIAAGIVCLGFAHQSFQRGQVTHILLFLQVAALACLLGRRFAWAGLLLGLGAALRLTPLLPAAAVGVGLVAAAVARKGIQPPLRFGGGLAGGVLLGFVIVPLVWLGGERASEVGDRWLEVTEQVYAANVDLDEDFKINEWRFKNQAPRRVYGTWTGWLAGASFTKERPYLPEDLRARVDVAAGITTWVLVAFALLLGAVFLRDPAGSRYAIVYAAVVFLPVLMTRYAWPTHYLMAAPALVFAARRHALAAPVLLLFVGTALFYAAHAKVLQPIGEAGCLMLASAGFLALLLRGTGRARDRARKAVLARYANDGLKARAYRALRLDQGRYEKLAAHVPEEGLVVDLGCGYGLLAHVLVDDAPGRRVLAVDHDEARVEALQHSAAGLPIDVRKAAMQHVELPTCAAVMLVDVLHYLPEEEQETLVARCVEALEPGGVLVVRDPDAGARLRFAPTRVHERMATRFGLTNARVNHYRTAAQWEALLQAQGLEVEVLRLPLRSPYADRTLIGRVP